MIPDAALNKILTAELLDANTASHAPNNVFAMFQRLAVQTKWWLRTDQLPRARKCFELVNSHYGKCSAKARMAIETAFMFPVACCLDGLPNGTETRELLPDTLKHLSTAHRHARDI